MLINLRINKYVIVLLGIVSISSLANPISAQSEKKQYNFSDNFKAAKDLNWNFSSVSDSLSLQDQLNELEEYSISETDFLDIKLIEESRNSYNRRGIKDYSIEAEIYE